MREQPQETRRPPPAVRHIQEAERQEFPADEFVPDEQTESE